MVHLHDVFIFIFIFKTLATHLPLPLTDPHTLIRALSLQPRTTQQDHLAYLDLT